MKNIFPFTIYIFIMAILFTSCSKDKASASNNPQFISASSWYYSNAQIDQNNDGVGDVAVPPSIVLPCYTDNFLTFNVNGTGVLDEGATKCNASDPQTVSFSWNFTNSEKNINFSTAIFPGATGEFKIIKLDNTSLVLSKQVMMTGFSSLVTVIITFIH